jgi:hypothetical protein
MCEWREDSDGNWDVACGSTWTFAYAGPQEEGYVYCPKCGQVIGFKPYVEPIAIEEES